MAATSMDEILYIFEQNWFRRNILFLKNPDQENLEKSQKPQELSRSSSQLLVRSFSDQSLSFTGDNFCAKGNVSPDSVLPMNHKRLQTVLSGKECEEFEEKTARQEQGSQNRGVPEKKMRSRRKKRGGSKSLSELEFEELKGFMDLGFVFSEEDRDSSLASVIPGLQRLGKKQGNDGEDDANGGDDCHDDEDDECRVSRPYLSEAWEMLDQKKEVVNSLRNWRIPDDLISNEIDMKNHLRSWAHTVASTVR